MSPLPPSSSSPHLAASEAPRWPSFGTECRTTLQLALPLISGQLSQMLMGVTDTVMLGRVGVTPLAASTLANTLLAVPFVVGFGLLSSVSVRVSQAHGAGEPAEAGEALRHGSWLALFWSLIVMIALAVLLPLLPFFGQPEAVVERVPVYLFTCALSLVPAMLTTAWKNHADALNRPWPPFWIGLGAILLNVLLNWLWIFGHLGFPALGLEGAGLATLTARFVGAVALFAWLTSRHGLPDWMPPRWRARWSPGGFRTLLRIGVPASLQMLSEVTAFVLATLMVGTLGVIPLAAHQVAITCAATSFMVPLGVAMATTVRVGEIVGAQERPRLRRVLAGSWLFALLFMSLSTLVFLVWGRALASWFVTDAEVVHLAAALLVVAGLFQLFDGLQIVSVCALRGVDDVNRPAWMAAFSYWGVALPLGWLLGLRLGGGATGVWWGLALGLAIAAVLLGWRAWRLLVPSPPTPSPEKN